LKPECRITERVAFLLYAGVMARSMWSTFRMIQWICLSKVRPRKKVIFVPWRLLGSKIGLSPSMEIVFSVPRLFSIRPASRG
jgi:hypothetical protein